jgi:O-antigen/teichoic acid export membrane protein
MGGRGGELLKGSTLFFLSSTIVNAGNYLFNLLLGRWLGPAAFADLSLIVTLFLVVSFIATGFQQTAAKFAAIHTAGRNEQGIADVRAWLMRWAWVFGAVSIALLGLGAPVWQSFFNAASALPFVIFALALPLYFAQGVDRGVLQGQTRFGALALSYQAEMWVRLAVAIALVALGLGVIGGTLGLAVSLAATWLVALRAGRGLPRAIPLDAETRAAVLRFVRPVIVAELGLILINNSDVLIVRRFFPAEEAGQYAALALIGRIVFFATWSVVVTMFPLAAQRHARGEAHRGLLWSALGLVAAVSAAITLGAALFPGVIINLLFGPDYLGVAPLLWQYALATALFAIGNVVVNYRLSLGQGLGTTIALIAGIAQVLGLALFHASLGQVIAIQIGIMAALAIVLLAWDAWLARAERRGM